MHLSQVRVVSAALGFIVLLAFAGSASAAVVFADGVGVDANNGITITNLGNSAGGGSETDDALAQFQNEDTVEHRADITWTFSSAVFFESGANSFRLIVDGDITTPPSIQARVIAVNGITQSTGQAPFVQLSGSGFSDEVFLLGVTLSSATDVTSVSIRFVMGAGTQVFVDAVATPEPTTFALFGIGLLGMAGWAWGHRRRVARASQPA
jgi:hypothetical protein